jgi:putative cardiolipin synthase
MHKWHFFAEKLHESTTRRGFCFGLAIALLGALAGCGRPPSVEGRSVTHSLDDTAQTRLAQAAVPLASDHPGLTGVYALKDGRSAFATRGVLIEAAQRSLDVQYYISHDDISGNLLFQALRRAAERGVRVRLLLDDNGIAGLDPTLGALDALPNLEVRLYNPFFQRTFRPLGYVTDFRRLNRRMHNKSLTADGAATVIGGRNVGDEYFGASEDVNFADLDLLAIGPVVRDVAKVFDQYWNSASAYPFGTLVQQPAGNAAALLQARLAELGGEPAVRDYLHALETSTVVRDHLAGRLPFDWVRTRVLADDPAKTLEKGLPPAEELLLQRLGAVIGAPQSAFDVVSPYFVPMAAGTDAFRDLAGRGVKVRVLTNSLAATDVFAVHAGYAKRRKALLEAGVRLFELQPTAKPDTTFGDWVRVLGGSGASLHAKTFAVDGQRAFVGSFNFDPRSTELNTEMGFVVDSPALAADIAHAFDTTLPHVAYEVRLDPQGRLEWVDRSAAVERVYTREPGAGLLKRMAARVASWLPIEWLL